jgi:hypothetical protein
MLGFSPSAGFVIKRDETNVVQQWFFMQRWNNLRELVIWKVLKEMEQWHRKLCRIFVIRERNQPSCSAK